MLQNSRKRARRRAWPIHGYVGPNGSGKSAAMVWDTMPSLLAGRPALSTVRFLDYENPRPCEGFRGPVGFEVGCELCDVSDPERMVGAHQHAHPLWVPFVDWGQMLDGFEFMGKTRYKRFDINMDEVTGVASSRESQGMPAPVANSLVQLRRRDIIARWSSPAWDRADKIIRQCSQAVTHCQGYMPVEVEAEEGEERLWRNRRLFKWKTYDAQLFEDFTTGKRDELRPDVVDWHWGPGSPVFGAYDTLDAVLSIGTVTDTGACYRCGGSRPRPKCSCPDHTSPLTRLAPGLGGGGRAEPEPLPSPEFPVPGRRRLASALG